MDNYYNAVRQILTENPSTRDDDMLLYGAFCAKYLIVQPNETFYEVMYTAKKRDIPSYESVTRARRKVQENEPALCGKRRKARKEEAEQYREWYRNN